MASVIQGIDFAAIAPPLLVAIGAVAVLMADAFGASRRVVGAAGAATLVLALGAAVALARWSPTRATFCVPAGLRARGEPAACSYVVDDFTLVFQILLLGAAIVVLLLSFDTIAGTAGPDGPDGPVGSVGPAGRASDGKGGGAGRPLPAGEFHFLLLAAVTGAVTLVAARDLIILVVSLEALSLPVFALVALRRYDGRASEAAVKLFLVSVVATAVTLFGISLLYGATGAVHLDRVADALARTPGELRPAVGAAVVLVLAGFAFKVAAVPFHFWAPDVYQGAPLPVAAFLSVVSKAAGFAGLLLVLAGLAPYAPVWGVVAGVLAAVTMTVGNLVALRQRHAVRLLAWSSVAQSGYMLAPLAVGAGDADRLADAMGATVAYVVMYAVMNVGAFAVVTAVARRPSGAGYLLDGYRGLSRSSPYAAAALAFFLVCLAGLPPGLMGLFAKIAVFRAVVDGSVTWLAVVMAVNTVIGLYYYLAWTARLYAAPAPAAAAAASAGTTAAASVGDAGAVGSAATGSPAGRPGPAAAPDMGPGPGPRVGAAIAVAAAGAVLLSLLPQVALQVIPLAGLVPP